MTVPRLGPRETCEALGLAPAITSALADRSRSYDVAHLGYHDVTLGALLALLRSEPALRPPRTGHLGNWEDIALGRAGAMDFNKAICGRGYGHALIYAFTQTEAEADGQARGDWVYLPGSLVDRGKRTPLALRTWDAETRAFVPRGREQALFCPFVQAELDGALTPLVDVHWRRLAKIPGFGFHHEAAHVAERLAVVRPLLAKLFEAAASRENPRRAFQDLVSHAVTRDGIMTKGDLAKDGAAYVLGGQRIASLDELVERALVPFRAVVEPGWFAAEVGGLPDVVPVLSHLVVGTLTAMFAAHYPEVKGDRAALTTPFSAHLHWGARDMAGYPPVRSGYFIEKSTTKSLRGICDTLGGAFPELPPVLMVLLPAAVFMLCPASAHPKDAELLPELFARTRAATAASKEPDRQMLAVQAAADAWLEEREGELSSYFLNRFFPRRGVLHAGELPVASEPVEPAGFTELTARQACMLVGALVTALQEKVR